MGKQKRKSGSGRILAVLWTGFVILTLLTGCAVGKGKEATGTTKPQLPELTSVKVEAAPGADRVVFTTQPENVPYSVYRWKNPNRLVVDFSGARLGKVPASISVADQIIDKLELSTGDQANGSNPPMARVMIYLKPNEVEYQSNREAGQLVLTISPSSPATTNSDLQPPTNVVVVDHGDSLSVAESTPPAAALPPPPAREEAKASSSTPKPASPEVSGPLGKNLLGIQVKKEGNLARIHVLTDGVVRDYSSFTLKSPDRLVVDLWGLKNQSKVARQDINLEGILRVRLGEYPDKVRLVFDCVNKLPHFRFDKGPKGLVVTFSATQDVSSAPEVSIGMVSQTPTPSATGGEWPLMEVPANNDSGASSERIADSSPVAPKAEDPTVAQAQPPDWGPTPPPTQPTPPPTPTGPVGYGPRSSKGKTYIHGVKFDCNNNFSTITLCTDRPIRYDQWRREDNRGADNRVIISLFISNAQLAPDLEKTFDTSEFRTSPIVWFSLFQNRERPDEVAVVIVLKYDVGFDWYLNSDSMILKFSNIPIEISGRYGPTSVGGEGQTAAGPVYGGPLVDLDFYQADILEVLRVIAEAAGVNIVVDSDVKGKVTIRLQGVPWEQALHLILEIQGLGMVTEETSTGKVIRVADKRKLAQERRMKYEESEEYKKYGKLEVRVIPINYLVAQDLERLVKEMLTPRGRVKSDRRTNSLIVQDIREVLDEVERVVRELDQPTQQVLIEARIVEALEGVTREIGVSWGTNLNVGPATGNPTGLNFPNTIQVGGAVLGGAANAPAISGTASTGGGAVGMTVGSLTNSIKIDVLLRALEAQEKIKIISSPRILVLTDEKATIQQGVSVPLPPPSVITGTSPGWQWIDAVLMLEVTPHVATHVQDPQKMIVLDLNVMNREVKQIPGSAQPGYSRKEAKTTIMLKDGETAVIGGIFKITRQEPVAQVPFLSQIPFIGWLFQDRVVKSSNDELLIFLTPQIVQPGGHTTPPGMTAIR